MVTVGELDGIDQPTVSISRVTITGGFNDSVPESFAARGGGVWIPPELWQHDRRDGVDLRQCRHREQGGAGDGGSARAGIRAHSQPAPASSTPGRLTVTNTRVTDNVAGSTASDPSVASYAAGGGIMNGPQGSLTLLHSFVSGNRRP